MIDISKAYKEGRGDQMDFLLQMGIDPTETFLNDDFLPQFANGGPFDNTDEYVIQGADPIVPPQPFEGTQAEYLASVPQAIINNQAYYVFGEGNNTRSVPVSAVDPHNITPYNQYESWKNPIYGGTQASQLESNTPQQGGPETAFTNSPPLPPQNIKVPPPPKYIDNDYTHYSKFSDAFNAARAALGKEGKFMWKGREFNTLRANEVGVISKKNSPEVSNTSGKKSPSPNKTPVTTTTEKNTENSEQDGATTIPGVTLINTNKSDIEALKKWNSLPFFSRIGRTDDLEKRAKRGEQLLNKKLDRIVSNSYKDSKTGNYVIEGKVFKNSSDAREYIEQRSGMKLEAGSNAALNVGKRIKTKEDGGPIERFDGGGETKQIYDPQNPGTIITVRKDDERYLWVQPIETGRQKSISKTLELNTGVNPMEYAYVTTLNGLKEVKLDGTEVYMDGSITRGVDANGNPISIGGPGMVSKDVYEQLNSLKSQNYREEQAYNDRLKRQNDIMRVASMAMGDTSFSVEDSLYKVGETLAYKPSEGDFKRNDGTTNTNAMNVASGFNLAKGIAAGSKALLGSTKNVMEGYATQKRNQLVMDEYYRKQRKGLMGDPLYKEMGGDIPFYNDGGYLQFFEDGNPEFAEANGPQDEREQLPLPVEMTGEFIQQQPQQAGIVPNAEVEHGEYIKHPDGQVQQVEGRTHEKGGERVALEPTTKVVSDNLKVGAKNAKMIKDEFGITNVKASDTFASVVEKFTKKVGLSALNEEQQTYFDKLKKETKTRDEETSELNYEVLSEKINTIEKKKQVLEQLRSNFTDYVYSLQEEAKEPKSEKRVENKMPGEDDIQEALNSADQHMEDGGLIKKFSNGGGQDPIDELAKYYGVSLTSQDKKNLSEASRVRDLSIDFIIGYLGAKSTISGVPTNYADFKNSKFGKSFGDTSKVTDGINKLNKMHGAYYEQFVPKETGNNTSTQGNPVTSPVYPNTAKTKEDFVVANNVVGTNNLGVDKGGPVWQGNYKPVEQWASKVKLGDVKFENHPAYQKFLIQSLKPQIALAHRDNVLGITNAGRKVLEDEYGVKDASKILYWKDLPKDLQEKFKGEEGDKFLEKSYVDGIPGHRGIRIEEGSITADEYKNRKGKFDHLTDDSGRQLYMEYDANGQPKVDANGQLVFYYPKDGKPTETKTEADPTKGIGDVPMVKQKSISNPVLPDMSLQAPLAMDSHLKAQHRYDTLDPIKLSFDDQLTEINRQTDSTTDKLTGLTDTQRAAALMELAANTQEAVSKGVSGVNTQNAQLQSSVDQFNNNIYNKEEDMRVADAQAYEALQLTAKAKTEQDYSDFMDKNREIRINRFNYLTKNRQINSMVEHFKTDEMGNIVFDNNGVPIPKVNVAGNESTGNEQVAQRTEVVKPDGSKEVKIVYKPKKSK